MKTLALSIPYGMSARNILRSAAYTVLKEHAKILLYSPLSGDAAFRQEFAAPNVVFKTPVPVGTTRERLLRRLLVPIQAYRLTKKSPQIETLQIARAWMAHANSIRFNTYRALGETIGSSDTAMASLENAYQDALFNPAYAADFKEHHVSLLFVTHGYVQDEFELAATAARLNIPTVAMLHSWDNITGKSGLRQTTSAYPGRGLPHKLYGRILVWNEVLKAELMDVYKYPENRITLTGIPQFDLYADPAKFTPRDEFFRSIKGDPRKKTVVYMGANPKLIPHQPTFIRILGDAARNQRLGPDVQFLVRGHPGTDLAEWARAAGQTDILLQEPSAAFKALAVETGWKTGREDARQLADTIYHSDVVVNVSSTTAIDAAALDTPSVCVGFDAVPVDNYFDSVRKLYDYTHYKKVVATGGLRVAGSEAELLEQVKTYLEDSALDGTGRALIRQQQCFKLDGKSGERVGRAVLESL